MIAPLFNGKNQPIFPFHRLTGIATQVNLYANTTTRMHGKTAYLTETPSPCHRCLQSASLTLGHVPEKSNGVEQV